MSRNSALRWKNHLGPSHPISNRGSEFVDIRIRSWDGQWERSLHGCCEGFSSWCIISQSPQTINTITPIKSLNSRGQHKVLKELNPDSSISFWGLQSVRPQWQHQQKTEINQFNSSFAQIQNGLWNIHNVRKLILNYQVVLLLLLATMPPLPRCHNTEPNTWCHHGQFHRINKWIMSMTWWYWCFHHPSCCWVDDR